jgi:hypothetical protein
MLYSLGLAEVLQVVLQILEQKALILTFTAAVQQVAMNSSSYPNTSM